ncbi:MAG: hypothetical protein LQ343_005529 [Gyalolechia ehrenbergii]|nr:MAG: hypothetical protein LQ343_005529 [Gyalolechia ehrenbergii]
MASAANKPPEVVKPGQGKETENEVKPSDEAVSEASTPQHSSSNPRILKRASTTSLVQTTSSPGSPKASRETSPVRPPLRSGVSANSGHLRSRKNSYDLSPNRGPALPGPIVPAVPSAAAIQRALSVAGAHQLQPSTNPDLNADPVRPQKVIKTAHTNNNPSASNIPRVRSPPPLTPNKGAVHALRKPDQSTSPTPTPSIIIDRSNRAQNPRAETDATAQDVSASTAMKMQQRGVSGSQPTLETVQESSVPSTPALGTGGPNTTQHGMTKAASDRRPERIDEDPQEDDGGKDLYSRPESGNESSGSKNATKEDGLDGKKQDPLKASAARPQVVHPKKSSTQLHPAKGKTGAEGSVKSMTVETETVSSIPQVALGGGTGERSLLGRADTGGSLRLKPSTETIRPKKEKKRVVRKAPSLNAGTGGLPSFRRFHHHHPFSRAPSPEQDSPRSFTSPESTPALVSDISDAGSSSLQSLDLLGARLHMTNVDSRPLYPDHSRRSSLSALTSVRGRVASSKSDIFEARVASAVDEANSSDSEETFVYQSNPPEPLLTRPHRLHSRTPSTTSMASQIDQYGARARQDGHHSIAGKKSMKFANNSYHSTNYPNEAGDTGTVHGPNPSNRGTPFHHRHVGHSGRNGHTSLFDNESPFPNATKPLRTPVGSAARLSPRPSSPRSPHVLKVSGSSRKSGEPLLYDLEGEGADDERTPLIGSTRSGRIRTNRRAVTGGSRNGYLLGDEKRQRACRTVTVYTSLATLMAALIAAVIIIMVMCSKPLLDVRIKDICNVLASEQEIMLDLHVHAVNPNLVAIQISDLDVNIFAKSKHVGTGEMWRNRGSRPLRDHDVATMVPAAESEHPRTSHPAASPSSFSTHGVDEGTDPITDPETDAQTMLLGRIFEFDSPLIFDPSPLHYTPLSSVGEVRLTHPGNKTEEGGSERWEKVLQYDFELIVRGVVKYGLPLSSVRRKASVGASVLVQVTKEKDDDEGRGSNTLLRKPGRGW